MQTKKILIVEDDNIIALGIKNDLLKLKYDVTEIVSTGEDAIKSVKKNCPDLILMDIYIKGKIDGVETAQKILKNFDIPIIYLTAYKDKATINKAKLTAPYSYILKPYDLNTFEITIDFVLNKHELERKIKEAEIKKQKIEKSHIKVIENIFKFIPDSILVFSNELNLFKKNKAFQDIIKKYSSMLNYKEQQLEQIIIKEVKKCITDEENVIIKISSDIKKSEKTKELILQFDMAGMFFAEEEEEEEARIVVSLKDITGQKKAEEALRLNEEKYRTMLSASPDGILLIDLKGIIAEVSEIGLELYGADNKDDLIGKHFLRFVPSGQMMKIREIIGKTQDEGLAQNIELLLKRKNQSLFVSEISSTLIQGRGGAPISFMIIIRDISQRKKIESQLIHAERMSSLGEMASGIAHEINQPLNTISLIFDNMQEASKNNSLSKNYFIKKSEKVFENILRIKNIIDHIKVFSRSEDDYIHTSFNVNKSIRNAISLISEQLKHKAIDLIFKPWKNIPSTLGNTYKFEQVILNLIINAQDSLEEKKNKSPEYFPMTIKIRTFNDEQNIIVEVKDNGAGIKDEDIDNIMLPFYSTKETGKGTGLGLSISFGIIKEMNGNIEIHSKVLKGTTILITLPI